MSAEKTFAGQELSGWWLRVAAYLLDGVFVFLLTCLLGLPLLLLGAAAGEIEVFAVLFFFFVIFAPIPLSLVYYGVSMSRTKENGQSPGKQIVGIAVIREDGSPVDWGYAMLRQVVVLQLFFGLLVNFFTAGIGLFLDFLWPLWDERKQALHDKMVSSRVVRTGQRATK